MLRLFFFGIAAALASANQTSDHPPPCNSATPSATIDIGVLHGTQTSLPYATAPVNKFLGIPYAQSPPLRFAPPQAAAKLKKPLNVTAWKPACVQQFPYPPLVQQFTKAVFNQPPPQESEDCLYINIYAPSTPAPSGGRAVLFWLFGGGLEFGHGGQPAYDGSAFAAYQDVVVVTFNYRTNAFGFPNSAQIPLKQSNPGFLDQHFALEWVQRNIHSFGGAKDKVTVFGESAGAFSIDALITSYPKHAPFRAAILESGQITYQSQPITTEPTKGWKTLIQKLNCSTSIHKGDDLACARAAPALTIKSIVEQNALTFQPTPDNATTLVKDFSSVRASGKFAKVPVLAGTNAQEGRVFAFSQTNLTAYLEATFRKTAPQVIQPLKAAFPLGNDSGINTGYDRISQIYTLLNFQCGAAFMANATQAQGVPTWRYYYNSSFPNIAFASDSGVYHSSEIQQVFQTYSGGPILAQTPGKSGLLNTQKPPTAQEAALSSFINGAWATFAKNPAAGPGWNRLGSFNGTDLGVLGGAEGQAGVSVIRQDVVDKQCALLLPQFRAANPGVVVPPKA